MSPVLNPGEIVLVLKDEYAFREPGCGEIVAANPVSLNGRSCVKRIVGLPRETVKIEEREWRLGEQHFFLLGDQQESSTDSRSFGPVSRTELIGPVWVRVWPWKFFL